MAALSHREPGHRDPAVVRSEAAELRLISAHLRYAAKRLQRQSAGRLDVPTGARSQASWPGLSFQSAWSELWWRLPDRDLDHVLVRVDLRPND